LILAGVWSLLLLATHATRLLEKGDVAFSLWAQSQPPQKTVETPSLALIAIDRIPTDRPWPWPRLDFAIALRALVPCFPQSVTFEALLHDRDQRQEAFDTTFAHLVERFDHVVFASAAFQAGSEMPPPQNLVSIPFQGSLDSLTAYHSLYWPVETFASNSHVGISNFPFISQKKPTSIPLIFRWRSQVVPSLALQAATIQLRADLSQSLVKLGHSIELRDARKKLLRVIPIDSQGSMRLRHRPLHLLTIPFDDFLVYSDQRERGETPGFDLRQLRQRQIWIGRTDDAACVNSGGEAPVRIQMLAVQNILSSDFIQSLPFGLIALLFLTFAWGVSGVITLIRLRFSLPIALVITALYVEMSIILLQSHNLLIPVPAFLLLSIGSVFSGLAARFWEFEEESSSGN
jgi:adenylate cyclase